MRLMAFGVNHKTAEVALRERMAVPDVRHDETLRSLRAALGCAEAAILSTCNRSEFYLSSHSLCEEQFLDWLTDFQGVDRQQLASSAYFCWDEEAIQHLMRVACGLDSLVLGEPQILGQLKSSYALAKEGGSLGSYLERCFQSAFSVAKEVRTETEIGVNPVSVAFAAVNLSKHIFTDLSKTKVLVVGAGETAELLATHFHENRVEGLIVANRTLERARLLADRFSGESVTLQQIASALDTVDIVVSSTASQLPIIGKGMVEAAMKRRKHRPLLMLDLAVPRDIEPEVADLEDAYLYTVDDLQDVVDQNRQARLQAAQDAEQIIQRRSEHFMQQLRELDGVGTLTCFRRKVESIREEALKNALSRLKRGEQPDEVLARMSRSMINKLMHEPSLQIRKAAASGQTEQLAWVQQLFGLALEQSDLVGPNNLKPIGDAKSVDDPPQGSKECKGRSPEH